MDWSDCPAVETKPDVQHGRPVVKGTRVTVEDSVLGNWEAGADELEIERLFPALKGKSRELREIISYAKRRMNVPRPA